MTNLRFGLILVVVFAAFSLGRTDFAKSSTDFKSTGFKKKTAKKNAVAPVIDWGAHAASELESAASRSVQSAPHTSVQSAVPTVVEARTTSPTAATIHAEVDEVRPAVQRSALRFTFLFEPYQPRGTGKFGSGEQIDYSNLPNSVLGQVDLRWLPFDLGRIAERPVSLGGYAAAGFSRQEMPLVASSGFRYDDVALNTLRFEGGAITGLTLGSKFNLEARFGAGRLSAVQTSSHAAVVGSFGRPYLVAALDLAYHVIPKFALVASLSRRTPLADGTGALAFDPFTVSGGFLVQVR